MNSTNSQISDAATESAVSTIDRGASLSMASLYMAAANATGLVMYDAALAQQGGQQIEQAVVATTCALIIAKATKP